MENTSNPSKGKFNLTLISIVSFIGAVISAFQTRQFFETRAGVAGFQSFCNIGQTFDCTAIEMSPYAELMGIPLSVVAIAGYLTIFGLSFFAIGRKDSRKFLLAFSAVAVLFSAAYLAIMIGVIGKLCVLCLAVDAVNVALLIFALSLPKDAAVSGKPMDMGLIAGVGVSASVLAFLFAMGLNPQAEMKKSDMTDLVESVMNAPVKAIDIPADASVIGNPNAKITIVKFSDYECPACRIGANGIHPLFKRYQNEVKFVFINFPLDSACNSAIKHKMHEFACEAAAVAICAQEQGKFLEAYEILFENQPKFKTGKITELLTSIPGLDMEKLKACTTQPSTSDRIKRDVELGLKIPIQSTPTFFINGKRVEGGLPTNLWMQVIDQMLKQ